MGAGEEMAVPQTMGAGGGCGVFQNLRKLISVIDELRDVGLQQYINLPRIVVVGTQSAGKSSVLEGIVGMDFLPRGDGVVTRRPLELRLIHTTTRGATTAKFEGSDRQYTDMTEVCSEIERLTDDVAGKNKGIVDMPIVLTINGPECPDLTLVDLPGITRVPLRNSDQTDDIETLTREMSRRYVEDPRTIILAVIPANQDISTSDALQLARKVDPRGLRTIGVITKLDLMDIGTNAAKMISGEEIPLRLGYIAVKNRNQSEIQGKKSVRACANDETQYFNQHPIYRKMSPHYFGMQNLINKLTRVLFKHIQDFLPHIKMEIATKQRDIKQRLNELGDGIPTDPAQKTQLVWSLINDYCEVFTNVIRGKYDKRLSVYISSDTNALYGGSQIRNIFTNLLSRESLSITSSGGGGGGGVSESGMGGDSSNNALMGYGTTSSQGGGVPPPTSGGGFLSLFSSSGNQGQSSEGLVIDMTDAEIDTAIRMHEGDSLPGFPTPDTFEYLILPYLQKLHFPVFECLDQVAYTLDQLLQHLSDRVFSRFPQLGEEVLERSRCILESQKEKTRTILENYVNAETGYIFTNDDSYLAAHGAMLSIAHSDHTNDVVGMPASNQSNAPNKSTSTTSGWLHTTRDNATAATSGTLNQIHATLFNKSGNTNSASGGVKSGQYSAHFLAEIRGRLNSYYGIILRNMRDSAPKTIGHFLVRSLQERLQFELYTALSQQQVQEKLLGEPDDIIAERAALKKQISVLTQAANVLQRDPTITNLIGAGQDQMFDDQYDWDLRNAGKDNINRAQPPVNVGQSFPQQGAPPQSSIPSQITAAAAATIQKVKLGGLLSGERVNGAMDKKMPADSTLKYNPLFEN